MTTIQLTLTIVLPEPANLEEVGKWIDFQIAGGSMSAKNPLVDIDLSDCIKMREDEGVIEWDVKIV